MVVCRKGASPDALEQTAGHLDRFAGAGDNENGCFAEIGCAKPFPGLHCEDRADERGSSR